MLKTILLLLISLPVYAQGPRVEVWFLSIDKSSWLNEVLPHNFQNKDYLVQSRKLQCQQMGDYCFDPQVGLYKRGEEGQVQQEIDLSEVEKKNSYDFMDPHKGVGRELIECDENAGFFDVFCGKAKKGYGGTAKLEVWVDVSSTMRQIDYAISPKQCQRELFLRKLSQTCPMNSKMKVFTFTEYRKHTGAFSQVCGGEGLNKMDRIVNDVKKSNAKNIIIITDIFEAQAKFIDALEAFGGVIFKGLDKPMYASQLSQALPRIRKFCQ